MTFLIGATAALFLMNIVIIISDYRHKQARRRWLDGHK